MPWLFINVAGDEISVINDEDYDSAEMIDNEVFMGHLTRYYDGVELIKP